MQETTHKEQIIQGTITEALPNTMFRIALEDGATMIAYLSGKMKLYRIKVGIGDTVQVLIDPYGGKGRIIKRM
jgi:translation initiation factor IF-1